MNMLDTEIDQSDMKHKPVMVVEMLEYLSPKDNELILDCTFGAGGYTASILAHAKCHVIGIDQDPTVQEVFVPNIHQQFPGNFTFVLSNFAKAFELLAPQQFDGIVMDLGVSSMQLDIAERGFSFMRDGPLDMRMSNQGRSASDFVNYTSEEDMANIIYEFGDEPASRRIAKRIVAARLKGEIKTTLQLASIVREAIGHRGSKIDPATKTFQAIRIFINEELNALGDFLANVNKLLKDNGRLVILSFHSLEDRIVKSFLKMHTPVKVAKSKYAKDIAADHNQSQYFQIITKRPIAPGLKEVRSNPRSRSAKLRAAVKVGGSTC